MNEIIKVFQDRVDELRRLCGHMSDGLRSGQPKWAFSTEDEDAMRPARHDDEGWRSVFDRSEAAQNYADAIEQAAQGVSRIRQETAIAKVQSDILSGWERDFMMRRRGRIRRMAHEATTRSFHESERGVFRSGIMAYLEFEAQRFSQPAQNGAQT